MATEGYIKFEYFSKGVPPYYSKNSFPELLDDESIVIQTPNIEMNYHQYFGLFRKFLMSVGFSEKNIMQGACNLAFNEMNDEKTMREVAEEYELIMSEQLPDIIEDRKKLDNEWIEKNNPHWEERYWAVYHKLVSLENEKRANDTMPSLGHSDIEALKYTDAEMDAMCDKAASDEEKQKCHEYNLREAEYYMTTPDQEPITEKVKRGYDYWEEDISNKDMWDQGMMKVTTNEPAKAWNGLIPGSIEAREAGCICPILDNEEMPDDKKWIDVECSIHGRQK